MNWQHLGGPSVEPPEDGEAERQVREDAAEGSIFETQTQRDDLADQAEDMWLHSRGY